MAMSLVLNPMVYIFPADSFCYLFISVNLIIKYSTNVLPIIYFDHLTGASV